MCWDGSIRLQRAPFSQPLDVAPREALFALALTGNLGPARATHLEIGVATREDQMKRWFTILAVTAIISAGVLAALTTRPAAAADDEVVTADRAATVAFEKGDKAAINKWVDPEFTWIDTDGVMWMLREALESHLKPLVPSTGDIKVVEHKYGNVVWIQDNLGKDYVAHTWMKRDKREWKRLQTSESSVHARDYPAVL